MDTGKTKTPQGKPSGGQRGGTGLKGVNIDTAAANDISNKYLEDEEEDEPQSATSRHPNRNTDKDEEDQ
jgi:hypothetical protein